MLPHISEGGDSRSVITDSEMLNTAIARLDVACVRKRALLIDPTVLLDTDPRLTEVDREIIQRRKELFAVKNAIEIIRNPVTPT